MEKLKEKRTKVKSAITRIFTYCNREDATEEGIHARIEKLEEHLKTFEQIQEQIESSDMTSEQAAAEEAYRASIEETYYAIKAIAHKQSRDDSNETVVESPNMQLTTVIESIAKHQTTLSEIITRMTENTTPTTVNEAYIQPTINETTKLPRIQLPVFDGTITNWLRFRDLFEATIHNKQNLCNIEKLEYLQCHLKGDALGIIKHISPSNDNYEMAWQLVKNKFNDYDQIKKSYLQLLFDQPSIKNVSALEVRRFINNINEGVNALKALNEPVDQWDLLLLFHLERKLDAESQTLWYRTLTQKQSFKGLMEFLELRLRELELQQNVKIGSHLTKNKQNVHTTTVISCAYCSQAHPIYACSQFKSLSIKDRRKVVQDKKLCFNCLDGGHLAIHCTRSLCKLCNQKHNIFLHIQAKPINEPPTTRVTDNRQTRQQAQVTDVITHAEVHTICQENQQTVTLIPTAVVLIKGGDQSYQTCRVMLDTGAQVSLISESCVQRLKLKRTSDNTVLYGLGAKRKNYVRGRVHLQIKSRVMNKFITTTALCMSTLTQLMPSEKIKSNKLNYFNNIQLADEFYDIPGPIDVILGADTLSDWLLHDKMIHPSGSPIALSTIFGWCICGSVTTQEATHVTVAHISVDFAEQLHKFWEIEEVNERPKYASKEEEQAEEYYNQTVTQVENGRYMVRLPFKSRETNFGNTINQATKRLINLEAKFKHNAQLKNEYTNFIHEYLQLDHMELSQQETTNYYLPHHAVLKPTHTTTKLRVVFDGSAKGSNGISLNEQLLVGPTIQNDLFTILMQFRKGKIGISGDIEKMYRQILVHPDDRPFQAILWREESNQAISTYQLKTVTYGTSSAPFLAIRTLHQVAVDNEKRNPRIADLIKGCFYVDDFMCGIADVAEAVKIKDELCDILSKAGFHLRKWSSNSQQFLSTVNEEDREKASTTIISDTPTIKTLGLYWDISADAFKYNMKNPDASGLITKRVVLSLVSRIFDPLGWISPVVITLKLFMQKLWITGIDWDTPIPNELLAQWQTFFSKIGNIKEISVPRWFNYDRNTHTELHGFADASEMAYAAVVYIKVVHSDKSISTRLLAAKTKVAPVNQVTLPRLELCAAQLVTKLLIKIKASLNIEDIKMYAWTDSMIVLSWLSDYPRKWKNFVANRTSYIINHLPVQSWRHITSKQNPADCGTRGLSPADLKTNVLWWSGPAILATDEYINNHTTATIATDLEKKAKVICLLRSHDGNILERYSDLNTLIRITARIFRFVKNCQPRKHQMVRGHLSTDEIEYAHNALIKIAQGMSYCLEIKMLKQGKQLSTNHVLSTLAPFLDDTGLLRVGGRLTNANIPYNQKHPLILHKSNKLTELIINQCHLRLLHAGVRQMQYAIGLKYWIPSVIQGIKRCVFKCTTCIRYRQRGLVQKMGNLPAARVNITTAFHNTGVDFAGPLTIRSWKGRGAKRYKAWIALFICMATKAVHIELVTELTTDAFIAALRRFVSRRGKPANIFSDNGTNFVGCSKRLTDITCFLSSTETTDKMVKETNMQGIQWHFSPPSSPNFGGLWEAGIKSIKTHLNKTLGDSLVTYEELLTVLCQIECCLNSRPLSANFNADEDPLTPGHFLILKNMQTVPDMDLSNYKINALTRWQYIQKLVQNFWRKWSVSYLAQLQNRHKWKYERKNLKVNDVVIIMNEQLPPSKWLIGRVIETHAGSDGLVRVVTVKTKNGTYKRPTSKLCPLLVD